METAIALGSIKASLSQIAQCLLFISIAVIVQTAFVVWSAFNKESGRG